MRVVVIAVAITLFGATAVAEDDQPKPRPDFSWDKVVGEGPTGFDKAMAGGDEFTIASVRFRRTRRGPLKTLARAIRSYEHAIQIRPKSSEAYYRAAQAIYELHIANAMHPSAKMTRKALRYWAEFEKLAPLDPRLTEVLFQKSLAHTKQMGDESFKQAIAIYDRLLGMSSPQTILPSTISIYLGNKAELHMMLGQLDAAIDDYYLAMEYGSRSWLGYGLAVALDRDGQGAKARQIMKANVESDRNMTRLSSDGTFFVPRGEKNYYLALGHETLGHYRRAIRYYQAFIRSGAHPRFHPRARAHIARLEPKARRQPTLRPKPRPRNGARVLRRRVIVP